MDYLEEHIDNVRKAFLEVSESYAGLYGLDYHSWLELKDAVCSHDISKFSQYEFTQYRKHFFPIEGEEPEDFQKALEHHKANNTHHHETIKNEIDCLHMIINWTAMGYKFGNTSQEYYEKNKKRINLSQDFDNTLGIVFMKIRQYNKEGIMEIHEAIEHAEKTIKNNPDSQCKKDYVQFIKWLKELLEIKKATFK
ncbi:MAG: DUF5662 family protein [Candidatus Desulfofervidaceae bacterium]|nr:DUF5662 family protein [Candidatus Desulfofervidaceae bacterium]